jgi:hypothetical protein
MLIDSRTLPEANPARGRLAIVGGGASPHRIAREFIGSGLRVALLESGGLDYDDDTRILYPRGHGNPSIALKPRGCAIWAGTSNHWAGYCRPSTRSISPPGLGPAQRLADHPASLNPIPAGAPGPAAGPATTTCRPWTAQCRRFHLAVVRPRWAGDLPAEPADPPGLDLSGGARQAPDVHGLSRANLTEIVTDATTACRAPRHACLDGRRSPSRPAMWCRRRRVENARRSSAPTGSPGGARQRPLQVAATSWTTAGLSAATACQRPSAIAGHGRPGWSTCSAASPPSRGAGSLLRFVTAIQRCRRRMARRRAMWRARPHPDAAPRHLAGRTSCVGGHVLTDLDG